MWLASLVDSQRHDFKNGALLDHALMFAPQVSSSPSTQPGNSWLLVYLGQSTRYWGLSPWPDPQKNKNHRFLKTLEAFSQKHRLRWTAAPTAPWATLAASQSQESQLFLQSLDRTQILKSFESCLLHNSAEIIADFFCKSSPMKSEWDRFVQAFEGDLGVHTLGQLRSGLHKEPQMLAATTERFGKGVGAYLKRLMGQDDLGLSWHNPTLPFFERFYLRLEKHLDSERTQEPLKRIEESLQIWCERLVHRKALLSRFQIQIYSDHRKQNSTLEFVLPKATRDLKSLMAIVQEKWLKLCQDSSNTETLFVDAIESIEMRSQGFVTESDRQLDLFEPNKEQISEDWAVLVGRLQAKSSSIEIGTFENFESFVPEKNHDWVPWGSKQTLSKIPSGGIRPELLYSKPQPFGVRNLHTQQDFLAWVFEQDAFANLEFIRDPWLPGVDRIYVRLNKKWLYWDAAEHKVFIHGIFDGS